jgi:hypothetical protein
VIEGVAGPESANNAATAGGFVPLFTLGIPTNAVMALILGALMIHGLQPGPMLLRQHPEVFWGTVVSMYIGNIMLLILNLPLIGLWVRVLRIPYRILFPFIFFFCIIALPTLMYIAVSSGRSLISSRIRISDSWPFRNPRIIYNSNPLKFFQRKVISEKQRPICLQPSDVSMH